MTVRWTVRAAEDRSRVAKPQSKIRLCVVATRPSPPAPAKKKAIRKSEWLFSVKSVLADGINPTSLDEIASR